MKQAGFAASFLEASSFVLLVEKYSNSSDFVRSSLEVTSPFPFFSLFLSFLDVCLQIDQNDDNPKLRFLLSAQLT